MRAILFISALLVANCCFGQKKISGAMGQFLQTEFMTNYMNTKIESENAVKTFQQNQQRYQIADVQKVRSEYDKIAVQFNALLEGVKNDFLDKKKLKYIEKMPESYSDGLELKLYKLSDQYAQGFQQALADASQNEIDGSAILLLIGEIIGLTKGMSDYFSKLRREARHYNNAYLHKHLILPNRWKSWDEIAGRSAPQVLQTPDAPFDPSSVRLNLPNRNGYNNNGYDNNQYDNNQFDNNSYETDEYDNTNGQENFDTDQNDYNQTDDNNYQQDPNTDQNFQQDNYGNDAPSSLNQTNQESNSTDRFQYGEWQTGQTDSLSQKNKSPKAKNFKKGAPKKRKQ